ncbi:site-specific integrase [Nonomuraea bangladeshensis]|uniref:site-specific integrase n=1 Tax=Nonomuraea bangladeshensis TaxID=404385 RepID=UPI0031DB2765
MWESRELRPSPVMVWTPAQLGAFLDVAAQHRLYALFHLIAFRGLRRGEGCGVRWEDLDTDERTLDVAKQLVQIGWSFEEGEPKTESSDGVIALDTGTVSVLKEHRARQNEERLEWGEDWSDTGRIFTHEDGRELHPAWVSELFSQLAYEAGLPPIRLHDLRHCAATLAYAAGADTKVVSTMLRHSSTNFTENTYTTVLPELAHAAAEASVAIVPRAVSPRSPKRAPAVLRIPWERRNPWSEGLRVVGRPGLEPGTYGLKDPVRAVPDRSMQVSGCVGFPLNAPERS